VAQFCITILFFNVDNKTKLINTQGYSINEELKTFARLTGHDDVHALSVDDLMTCNSEISNFTNIEHV